jgi:hypothetical protein
MENIENIIINNNLIGYNNKNHKMVDNLIFKELNKKLKYFEYIFKNFSYLEENDKITFDNNNNNKIDIDKYSITQGLRRWYNGHSRQIMKDKLNELFNIYKDFIRLVELKLTSIKNIKFLDLCIKCIDLNNQISKGLIILSETYRGNKDIFKFLNNMIYNIDLCSNRLKCSHLYKKTMNNY